MGQDRKQKIDGSLRVGRGCQQRRDEEEQDARRREVGDASDVVFQVNRRWSSKRLSGAWPGVGCRASYRPAGGRTMQGAAPESWVTALRPPISTARRRAPLSLPPPRQPILLRSS